MNIGEKLDLRSHENMEFLEAVGKKIVPFKGLQKRLYRKFIRSKLSSLLLGPRQWDPWIFKDENVYRLFYLEDAKKRPISTSGWWWDDGKICQAISNDGSHWKKVGTVLEPNPGNPLESGRLMAGSIYKENNKYYLFYSASGSKSDGNLLNEIIGLATSNDGLRWERYPDFPLINTSKNNPYYGSSMRFKDHHCQCRDPYVVKHEKDGKYYLFFSASKIGDRDSIHNGCPGLAVANNVYGPYKLMPPVLHTEFDSSGESPFYETERPQVIFKHGKYHLFFSCGNKMVNKRWLNKTGFKNIITFTTLYWYVSDDIKGPYKPAAGEPFVKGSHETGLYGVNFTAALDDPNNLNAYGWNFRYMALSKTFLPVSWTPDSIKIICPHKHTLQNVRTRIL
jgi:beta-fructofuranosidase